MVGEGGLLEQLLGKATVRAEVAGYVSPGASPELLGKTRERFDNFVRVTVCVRFDFRPAPRYQFF